MFELAQLNVAQLLAPIDHPSIVDYNNGIATINGLAEHYPGFIWRMKDESAQFDGFSYRILHGDRMIFTLSVWKDVESLKQFTYFSDHVKYYRRRVEWFEKMNDFN